MQVDDPSILTKPGPYSAHGFAAVLAGRSGTDVAGLSGFRSRDGCAKTDDADNTASPMMRKLFRIADVIADDVLLLPDELKALKPRQMEDLTRRQAGSAKAKAGWGRPLARPDKRHYTFARLSPDRLSWSGLGHAVIAPSRR